MYQHSSTEREMDKWFLSDAAFHELYPKAIRDLARRHWTPLLVARKAASFLATDTGARILDIGSGAGKFCIAAGYYQSRLHITGVEQRAYLVEQANNALRQTGLENVTFINANFTQIKLKEYDHYYFYNSFYENLAGTEKIDEEVEQSVELFEYYSHYLCKQLYNVPKGTRLVTYHSLETEIPPDFQLVSTDVNDYLKFWIKI